MASCERFSCQFSEHVERRFVDASSFSKKLSVRYSSSCFPSDLDHEASAFRALSCAWIA